MTTDTPKSTNAPTTPATPALDATQGVQEQQYEFPYHYIPHLDPGTGRFTTTRHWSWGMRYLGGLELVIQELEREPTQSVIDIGCGDGRLLRELGNRHPEWSLAGVDYSQRSIDLARAMNPGVRLEACDITRDPVADLADAGTLVEVLEHIPPDAADDFLRAAAGCVRPGGRLIVTVPHTNKKLNEKHYRHFDGRLLRDVLEPHAAVESIIPFDRRSRVMWLMQKLLGGHGKRFVITDPAVNTRLYRHYLRHHHRGFDESICGRIAAVCRVRP